MSDMYDRIETAVVELDPRSTSLVILDLSKEIVESPVPTSLLDSVNRLLDQARTRSVPVLFTVSRYLRGTPGGEVFSGLDRREDELILYPDHFDKFAGGDLTKALIRRRSQSVVLAGYASNYCVMHTAVTGARFYNYEIVVPVDAVDAATSAENSFALHHLAGLRKLPADVVTPVKLTNVADMEWTAVGAEPAT